MTRPVWYGGEQKSCDDGTRIAKQHLMTVPDERIPRAGPRGNNARHPDNEIRQRKNAKDRTEQEKRPESQPEKGKCGPVMFGSKRLFNG